MKKEMEIDNKKIGQRIRYERKKLQLSREEFAEFVDLSSYYIGQLERGERQMSLTAAIKIAKALHISLDHLIWGEKLVSFDYSGDYILEEGNGFYADDEMIDLLSKCSPRELDLFKKLIKTIIPFMR